ncbi:MAG: sulfatase [Planctomycetes bacterium]|nr:sulfatase [Planctomycetota bacterium]
MYDGLPRLRNGRLVGTRQGLVLWGAVLGAAAGLADGVFLYLGTSPGPRDWKILLGGAVCHGVLGFATGVLALSAAVLTARLARRHAGDEPRLVAGGLAVGIYFLVATFLANWVWAPRGSTWTDAEGLTSIALSTAFSILLARAYLGHLRASPFGKALLGRLARWPVPLAALAVVLGASAALPAAREAWRAREAKSSSDRGRRRPVDVPRPYSVVVIVADTLRPDRLSCYGYGRKTSPAIDRLAGEGVLFRNAYSSSCWSVPGHASLFTGRYPDGHGADIEASENLVVLLAPENRTLAEVLDERGYRTAAFTANMLVGPLTELDQGFQLVEEVFERRLRYADYLVVQVLEKLFPESVRLNALPVPLSYGDGSRVTDGAVRFIEDAGGKEPFFLFVNYMDAHNPHVVPSGARRRFFDPPEPYDLARHRRILDRLAHRSGENPLEEADYRFLSDVYDGAVSYLDEQVGTLVAALEKKGILEDTIVVVTSDHGESIGEHGAYGHLNSLHEEEVRIPLVVRYPGRRKTGAAVGVPVSIVDVFPTVLEVLGIPFDPDAIDGHSLAEPIERPILLRVGVSWPWVMAAGENVWHGCRVGGEKIILDNAGRVHLYDLARDPLEQEDLAPLRPQRVEELLTVLLAEIARARRNAPSERPRGTDDLRRRLEAMGYLK